MEQSKELERIAQEADRNKKKRKRGRFEGSLYERYQNYGVYDSGDKNHDFTVNYEDDLRDVNHDGKVDEKDYGENHDHKPKKHEFEMER